MGKASIAVLAVGLLAGCSGGHSAGSRNAAAERASAAPGEGGANSPLPAAGTPVPPTQSDLSPRLARLADSRAGDTAAHHGTLEVAGRCIFVNSEGVRSLIASMVPDARWDDRQGVLVVNGARLRPGAQISLSGSFAPVGHLRGHWVDPPAQECITRRAWVAAAISPR